MKHCYFGRIGMMIFHLGTRISIIGYWICKFGYKIAYGKKWDGMEVK